MMKTLFARCAFSLFSSLSIYQTPTLTAALDLERAYSRKSVDLPEYECDNLYSNAKDMVVLSQYIYLHAEMKEEAQEEATNGGLWSNWSNKPSAEIVAQRGAAIDSAKTIGDVISLANSRTDLFSMKKGGKTVIDSVKVVENDLSDDDNIGRTSDSSIEILHADEEDRHRSLVYAITKHEEQKRIVIIFRGTSSTRDWLKDGLIFQKSLTNPVTSKAGNLPVYVGIHKGFANALLMEGNEHIGRVEKILREVKGVMEENPTYKLFITGHSLGGALATLFGFYAAANDDPIYTNNGPVQVYSVSSPRTGNKAFLKSFKHLEERGKLRHARIYNARDKVSMLPYMGGSYKHVGLGVKLRFKNLPIRLDYPLYEGWRLQSSTITLRQHILAIPEAVRFHGMALVRDRLKLSKDALLATTIEIEYKKIWGLIE
mmetsp:Transcript_35447/g.42322  ORF Transcript_35447/g.42322 Transcript_35447/m.42322 type:complete len:429 (-) Transcript_35447:33-1319(-)